MSTVTNTATSPLTLPRDQWTRHPHYPRQTLLLNSHESFRRTSRVLLRRAEGGSDAAAIGWVFRAWKAAMRSHEGYEEHKLYPYLERRWGLSMATAEEGHRKLAELDAAVRGAVTAIPTGGDATPALADALRAHDEALVAHLALEEALVIPALLALEPAEFEDYSMSDIRGLLQRLDEREAASRIG